MYSLLFVLSDTLTFFGIAGAPPSKDQMESYQGELAAMSGHYQNKQPAGNYETAAEKNPVIRYLLEKNERNHLRHLEKDGDVDTHQLVKIEATFVNHKTVREQS